MRFSRRVPDRTSVSMKVGAESRLSRSPSSTTQGSAPVSAHLCNQCVWRDWLLVHRAQRHLTRTRCESRTAVLHAHACLIYPSSILPAVCRFHNPAQRFTTLHCVLDCRTSSLSASENCPDHAISLDLQQLICSSSICACSRPFHRAVYATSLC